MAKGISDCAVGEMSDEGEMCLWRRRCLYEIVNRTEEVTDIGRREKKWEKKENMEGNGHERVILVLNKSTSYVRREQLIRKELNALALLEWSK